MQEPSTWVDGIPWGFGHVHVCMMAYYGDGLELSPQVRAYHAHHYYLFITDTAPRETREGVALYHPDDEMSFCIIGWTRPIFIIEQPKLGREN